MVCLWFPWFPRLDGLGKHSKHLRAAKPAELLRAEALSLSRAGKSVGYISREVKRGRSTVYNWLKKYTRFNALHDRPRSGRPRKLDARTERKVVKYARDPKLGSKRSISRKLRSEGVEVGPGTVRNTLIRRGLRSVHPQPRPRLIPRVRQQRLEWAREHQPYPKEEYHTWMFTDEKRFVVNTKRRSLWIKKNEPIPAHQTRKCEIMHTSSVVFE